MSTKRIAITFLVLCFVCAASIFAYDKAYHDEHYKWEEEVYAEFYYISDDGDYPSYEESEYEDFSDIGEAPEYVESTDSNEEPDIFVEVGHYHDITFIAHDIDYELVFECGEVHMILMLTSHGYIAELDGKTIDVSLPYGGSYEIDTYRGAIIITPHDNTRVYYNFSRAGGIASFWINESPFFDQTDRDDPRIWYTAYDRIVWLAPTPTGTIYTRLNNEITAAATAGGLITHIMLTFHINVGSIGMDGSVMRIRDNSTVVLIGAHGYTSETDVPDDVNSIPHIVFSDTASTNEITRPFRVRGNAPTSPEHGLVFRNIVLQKAANAVTGVPATAPVPLSLASQTGNNRGGGIAVEPTDGGGGRVVLCRNTILRHSTTNDGGAIHVQTDSRLILMPGSQMYNNAAASGGGAIRADSGTIVTIYENVVIRDNHARGYADSAGSAAIRGSGGAIGLTGNARVYMHGGTISGNRAFRFSGTGTQATLGTGGAICLAGTSTFTMYDGEIYGNIADNSGGAIRLAGGTFHMYGGVIRGNEARGILPTLPLSRAVGGAVFIQAGTFNMNGGEIYGNLASLHSSAPVPTNSTGTTALNTTHGNARVTSSGGAVFAIGTTAVINMHGGTIRDNEALRTRHSNVSGTHANVNQSRIEMRAGNGGGVYLTGGARLNMHGGEIHSNVATATGSVAAPVTGGDALNLSNGGGVYLTGAGTVFHMLAGSIYNNHAIRTLNSAPTTTADADRLYVVAGNGGGVHVFAGATFTMDGGKIHSNFATAEGANPTNSLENNVILANGGGVFIGSSRAANSVFNMNGGIIHDNHAIGSVASASAITGNGGGVYVTGFRSLATDATFSTFNMTASVEDSLIFNNHATGSNVAVSSITTGNGGGVCLVNGGRFVMDGGYVFGNGVTTAPDNPNSLGGGGVAVIGHPHTAANSIAALFDGSIGYAPDGTNANRAPNGGGMLITRGGSVTMSDSALIIGNISDYRGGGVFITGGVAGVTTSATRSRLAMNGGHITGNIADAEGSASITGGGGVYINESGRLYMRPYAVINNNTAYNGGGVLVTGALGSAISTFQMHGGTIDGNTALQDGGGIWVDGIASLHGTAAAPKIISGNTAVNGGGAWVNHNPAITGFGLHREAAATAGVSFTDNTATNMGGAIFTVNHEYESPLTVGGNGVALFYRNLTFSADTEFHGNRASFGVHPPSNANATALPNILFEAPVSDGFNHPLNNHDINFILEPVLFEFFKTDAMVYSMPRTINLLEGAQFRLFRTNEANLSTGNDGLVLINSDAPSSQWEEVPMIISESQSREGALPISFYMTPGFTYQLVEIASPVGFMQPMGQWRIRVDESNPSGFSFEIIGGLPVPVFVFIPPPEGIDDVEWYLGNWLDFSLPLTGGSGTRYMYMTGSIMLIFAALFSVTVIFSKKLAKRGMRP